MLDECSLQHLIRPRHSFPSNHVLFIHSSCVTVQVFLFSSLNGRMLQSLWELPVLARGTYVFPVHAAYCQATLRCLSIWWLMSYFLCLCHTGLPTAPPLLESSDRHRVDSFLWEKWTEQRLRTIPLPHRHQSEHLIHVLQVTCPNQTNLPQQYDLWELESEHVKLVDKNKQRKKAKPSYLGLYLLFICVDIHKPKCPVGTDGRGVQVLGDRKSIL